MFSIKFGCMCNHFKRCSEINNCTDNYVTITVKKVSSIIFYNCGFIQIVNIITDNLSQQSCGVPSLGMMQSMYYSTHVQYLNLNNSVRWPLVLHRANKITRSMKNIQSTQDNAGNLFPRFYSEKKSRRTGCLAWSRDRAAAKW